MSALFAFPITVSAVSIGTLGLHRHEPGGLGGQRLGLALDAVEEIARALLDHQMWASASEYAADGSATAVS